MTLRSVEMMRAGFAAFSRGDFDSTLDYLNAEVEWHLTFRLPDLPPGKTVFTGHDEVRELWEAFASAFDELAVDLDEPTYESEDVIVVRARFHGRGAGSGVEVDRVVHYVQRMRDDKLIYMRAFDTEREALEAAGVAA